MFGLGMGEVLIILVLALIFIGPKDRQSDSLTGNSECAMTQNPNVCNTNYNRLYILFSVWQNYHTHPIYPLDKGAN